MFIMQLNNFGETLKKLRKDNKGLTLPVISSRSGIDERKIIRLENGETKITLEDALALLEVYGYKNNLNILIGRDNNESK
jgi:transcriptional regulator with XRE-family HTH domain